MLQRLSGNCQNFNIIKKKKKKVAHA
jgi:hypothetical protein